MRCVIVVAVLGGCAPTFEQASGLDDDAEAEWQALEDDPFDPVHPVCWPTSHQQARFDDNLPQRGVFPWSGIAGVYHAHGDAPAARLEIFEEGRYEWRSFGCTGTVLETGIVDHAESWVVLEIPECRHGREPRSPGVFWVGEHRGRQVLADPDTVQAEADEEEASETQDGGADAEGLADGPPIFFPSIRGKLTAWYERE